MNFGKNEKNKAGTEAEQSPGYKKPQSHYEKEGRDSGSDAAPGNISLAADPASPADPDASEDGDALERLRNDPEVQARMAEAMGRDSAKEDSSLQGFFKKGVGTLGRSLKKVARGEDLLDEDDK